MNENWLEIVDIYLSVFFFNLNLEDAQAKVESWFRMLGWRKANGSMLSSYNIDNEIIPIVLFQTNASGTSIPVLPILIDLQSQCSKILDNAKFAIEKLDCNMCLTFGKELKIFHREGSKDVECISQLRFDSANEVASKLFDLLDNTNFSISNLDSFCISLRDANDTVKAIETAIESTEIDQDLFRSFIKDSLSEYNFNEQLVDEILNQYTFILQKTSIIEDNISDNQSNRFTACHDNTRFSLDGKTFLSKRGFALQLIRKYVEDHPNVTIDDIEAQFPSKIISKKRGVVRPLETVLQWVSEDESIRKRFCLKEDEIITLNDGMKIVVYNQWGEKHFPKLLYIAKQLYNVESNQPYSTEYVDIPLPRDVVTNHAVKETSITISENSLKTFANNK